MVDATVIKAARSRPKKNRHGNNTQDPEAAYNVKLGSDGKPKTTYAYKLHAKTDVDGMIENIAYRPSKVHDSQMLTSLVMNRKYMPTALTPANASLLGNKSRILPHAYRNLTNKQYHENRRRQKTRNVVERTFAHLKFHFNLTKARYLGKARNYAFALLAAIAYNIRSRP